MKYLCLWYSVHCFFINTYNMCMQVVECCGKNPHLQVAIPHLWRLHLIPAVFRRIILCACIRKTVWKIGLYRVWAGQSPGYNVPMPGGKLPDAPCKMCLSLMYFFVFRLRAVRPAAGKRGFCRCITGFYTVYCHLYAEAYRYFASAFGELMPLVSLLPTGI